MEENLAHVVHRGVVFNVDCAKLHIGEFRRDLLDGIAHLIAGHHDNLVAGFSGAGQVRDVVGVAGRLYDRRLKAEILSGLSYARSDRVIESLVPKSRCACDERDVRLVLRDGWETERNG